MNKQFGISLICSTISLAVITSLATAHLINNNQEPSLITSNSLKNLPIPALNLDETAAKTETWESSSSNQSKSETSPSEVLIDYRLETTSPLSPNLPANVQNSVIEQVLARAGKKCPDAPNPIVAASQKGTFTGSGAQETVYLIQSSGNCGRKQAIWQLALFSNEALIAVQDIPYYSIQKLTDVDRDGIHEILLEGGGTGQGYSTVTVTLMKFSQSQFEPMQQFTVYLNNFGTRNAQLSQVASVVSIAPTPSGQLTFKQENYLAKCTRNASTINAISCSPYQYLNAGEPSLPR